MGSASSKSESELPENKSATSSASESIHVEFERIEKNVNKSIHSELAKAEKDIADLFIKSEKTSRSSSSNPEVISISVGSSSDKLKKLSTDSATISATSPVSSNQRKQMNELPSMSSSSSSESASPKPLKGGLTESEIDIRVVPLTNQLNGGARSFEFSDSSPFITSEVFKKSLEQAGGAESEFDSNKLLNIIMQMGGDDEDKKSDEDSDSEDKEDDSEEKDDEDDSESLFSSDDEDDEDDDEESSDVFAKGEKEPVQVARIHSTSSMARRTPKSDSSDSSSSSSSSSSSDSSSSSSSSDSSDSSDSEKLASSLDILKRATNTIAPMASLSGLNSSDSASVYILSSESSIGSRDINLLSFDEPAWGKSKKSKKSKK